MIYGYDLLKIFLSTQSKDIEKRYLKSNGEKIVDHQDNLLVERHLLLPPPNGVAWNVTDFNFYLIKTLILIKGTGPNKNIY